VRVLRITYVSLLNLKHAHWKRQALQIGTKKILQDNYASNVGLSPYDYDEDYRIMSHTTFFK
jgi:hypothetical protein